MQPRRRFPCESWGLVCAKRWCWEGGIGNGGSRRSAAPRWMRNLCLLLPAWDWLQLLTVAVLLPAARGKQSLALAKPWWAPSCLALSCCPPHPGQGQGGASQSPSQRHPPAHPHQGGGGNLRQCWSLSGEPVPAERAASLRPTTIQIPPVLATAFSCVPSEPPPPPQKTRRMEVCRRSLPSCQGCVPGGAKASSCCPTPRSV